MPFFVRLETLMALDQGTLQQVARLARLKLDANESARLESRLNDILSLIDDLQQTDVAALEPLSHPLEIHQPLRDDRVTAHDWRKQAMALAPSAAEDCFLVPQVIE
jgi:aspartyl-tRNA(Asn)/glutamyl-tRNA(Gln) amidotransferase subunit C